MNMKVTGGNVRASQKNLLFTFPPTEDDEKSIFLAPLFGHVSPEPPSAEDEYFFFFRERRRPPSLHRPRGLFLRRSAVEDAIKWTEFVVASF